MIEQLQKLAQISADHAKKYALRMRSSHILFLLPPILLTAPPLFLFTVLSGFARFRTKEARFYCTTTHTFLVFYSLDWMHCTATNVLFKIIIVKEPSDNFNIRDLLVAPTAVATTNSLSKPNTTAQV